MTAHQSHNIPWTLIVENLVFRTKPGGTEYDHYPAGRAGEGSVIHHFARKFAAAILNFSETERAKYPASIALKDGKIFPDTLLSASSPGAQPALEKEHQTLAFWRSDFGRSDGRPPTAFKALFLHEAVDSLLCLAQQKEVSLERFEWVTYSNFFHYGTRRILTDSLAAYILINVHIAMGLFGDHFRTSPSFVRTRRFLTQSTDYDLHAEIHREFFRDNEELQNTERLKPYLKKLFKLLYLWDMVCKEYGNPVDWEKLVPDCLQFIWDFTPDEPEPC